ncbi:MAG: CHASE3 domain-containing protein [Polyangiales bacterium]|nr:CHASE3 domain-containing protein [Myxococcales bacterium]
MTFGWKVGMGFASSILIMIVIAFVGYRSTTDLLEQAEWVNHTREVRKQLGDLLTEMLDAETGQRGYILTGDESFLEPYQSAVVATPPTLARVRSLTSDNPRQQRRLERAAELIEHKLGAIRQTIGIRRSQGFEPTREILMNGEGKKFMDDIRAVLDEMHDEEQRLLDSRNAAAADSSARTKQVLVWGAVIGALLALLIGAVIISTLSRQIGGAVTHIRSSSSELQTAANQQATGIREQSTAMNEITTTISELLATTRQIAESAQRVAQIAEQTSSAARSGDGIVTRAQESMTAIQRQVDLIVSHMLEVGKKSQYIGGVLDIVSELAEQTNILAINATIEAAGAGESGRRFAIVADEIRKLADRVTSSTKEIRSLIDDMRSAVNTTVMATETGSKAVDSGSRQFGEVTTSFSSISELVITTTEASREIELSTKQQATAVEQVNVAISNVAQASKESEASSAQTLQTAQQLAALSIELHRIVQPDAST